MTRVPLSTRLPPGLHEEATAHAAEAGLSLNALLAVALREYLDARRRRPTRTAAPLPPAPASSAGSSSLQAVKAPGGNRNAPCPCGATKVDQAGVARPVKWKHCHGRRTASTEP